MVMIDEKINAETVRDIINALPQKNCGKCGFENCGKFALALTRGEDSPFGCQQDFPAGYSISRILGIEITESMNSDQPGPQKRIRHHIDHGGHHRFGHFRHSKG